MNIRGLTTGTAIAALLVYVTGPLWAQEDDGGLKVSLGVQQSFGFGDNLALGVPGSATNPEEGRTSVSTTSFALNVESVTRTEAFRFQTGGALRYGSTPAGSALDTGFVDPFVELSYDRQGANARFSFGASYAESDISQSRPLWDFSDDDNVITPASDLSTLEGTGTRIQKNANIELEVGQNSPLGFLLRADVSETEYENETSANLNDFSRSSVSGTAFFRFNPTTTGVATVSVSRFSEVGVTPDRETRSAEVGLDQELANEAQLSFRIGYTDADRDNAGRPGDTNGTSGSIAYDRRLPDGSMTASYSLARTANGEIDTVSFGRTFDLATGSFGVNLGASTIGGGSAKVIGGLNWLRETRDGQYSVQLDRRVLADSNDEDRFTTSLTAQYRQDINAFSSFVANFSYFVADGSATANKVERSNLALSYEYELTEDWNLNSGVNLRMRDETTVGRARSEQIFFNLSRKFDLY